MKALVVSDSHGDQGQVRRLMEQVVPKKRPRALVFCGDGLRDMLPYAGQFEKVLAVRGNCDWMPAPGYSTRASARLQGVEVLVTHGHLYQVKGDTNLLLYAAMEAQAAIVCYGHTHMPKGEWQQGVLLLNPGALADGRYALLDIDQQGAVSFSLCRL